MDLHLLNAYHVQSTVFKPSMLIWSFWKMRKETLRGINLLRLVTEQGSQTLLSLVLLSKSQLSATILPYLLVCSKGNQKTGFIELCFLVGLNIQDFFGNSNVWTESAFGVIGSILFLKGLFFSIYRVCCCIYAFILIVLIV